MDLNRKSLKQRIRRKYNDRFISNISNLSEVISPEKNPEVGNLLAENNILQVNISIEDQVEETVNFDQSEDFSVENGEDNDSLMLDEIDNEDSDQEATEQVSDNEVKHFLAIWALRHNLSHLALNELLTFLKSNVFSFLPVDSRTLLKTPRIKSIKTVEPGEYIHIGLKNGINTLLQNLSELPNEIIINFNIDGIPLSRSSSSCFWPILAQTNISKKILVVGVYHGYGQPRSFNDFLRTFVDELKELTAEFEFKSKHIQIKIGAFICDTPARAHVLGIKSHAAYSGCPRCAQEGEYVGRVIFPELNARERTNDSFRNRLDEHHHKQTTILEELDIDLVLQFVLDYMHLVLLGVTKKLLKMFTSGGIESLLPSKCIAEINKIIDKIRATQPSDFQRKIQLLNQLHNYKATEFRTFLLYAGPFVLRNVLTKEKYDHFMLLNVAISLLCTHGISDEKIEFSRELINEFIEGMRSIYGAHHLVFNVHALTHLPDDVKKFGPLDLISAFDFESYMHKLQKLLRKKHQPLSQIYNRIMEMNNILVDDCTDNIVYPLLKKPFGGVFNEVQTKNFTINNSIRNCWVLTNKNEIIKFIHAIKKETDILIFASEVVGKRDFYQYPVFSSNLNIFKTSLLENIPKYWSFECLKAKLFCMEKTSTDIHCLDDSDDEDEDYYYDNEPCRAFFPILHSELL